VTATMSLVLGYLDPGSGSMIVQILVGGVAAVGVSLKLFWRRILTFLRIRKPDDVEPAKGAETS
jgi:hypothetical protein